MEYQMDGRTDEKNCNKLNESRGSEPCQAREVGRGKEGGKKEEGKDNVSLPSSVNSSIKNGEGAGDRIGRMSDVSVNACVCMCMCVLHIA